MSAATFTIAGESFRCVDHVPTWSTMKLAKAMQTGDEMEGAAALYDFVLRLVHPDEHARLDAHLDAAQVEVEAFESAIGDALVALAGRGNVTSVSSGPSSDGSNGTGTTSRVVSFSRGTVDVQPTLSAAATSSTG